MRLKIGVFFGGTSILHDQSILTFLQVIKYINSKKYEVIPIYIGEDNNWYTKELELFTLENFQDKKVLIENLVKVNLIKKEDCFILVKSKGLFNKKITPIDLVLNLCQGLNLEDGTLTGYFKTLGITYVGSNVLSASIGSDLLITKQILQSQKIPFSNYIWFYETDYVTKKENILASITKLGYPVIVKPASLGSNVGASFVLKAKDIDVAIQNALYYDEKIIVEEAIENVAFVSCCIYGNHEIMEESSLYKRNTSNKIITFEDKAKLDNLEKLELDKKQTEEILNIAKKIFYLFDLKGIVTFDFLIDNESKKVYFDEINVTPSFLAFNYFDGFTFEKVLEHIISLSIKEHKVNNKKIVQYKSSILKNKYKEEKK